MERATGKRPAMSTTNGLDNDTVANDAVAQAICERREYHGQRFAVGSFVAIAGGQVLGVGDSFDAADAFFQEAGVDEGEGLVCEVADPVMDVIR